MPNLKPDPNTKLKSYVNLSPNRNAKPNLNPSVYC